MTIYVDGVPILSKESYQEEKNCDFCGNVLPKGPSSRFILEGKEPFREWEVCGYCAVGKTNLKEKD